MKLPLPLLLAPLAFLPGVTALADETALTEKPVPLARSAASLLGRQAPDAPITSLTGETTTLAEYVKRAPLTVVAMTGTACPLCQKLTPTLAELEKKWSSRGVRFLFVNPMASEPTEAVATAAARFQGSYIRDTTRAVAAALQASSTTEVFLLDSTRTLLYRGAVDDQYGIGYQKSAAGETYLEDALKDATAGRRPRVAATTAPGCALETARPSPSAHTSLTWNRDVSRLVAEHCQDCHRSGGVAPFPLVTMADVTDHAGMIRRVITKGLMPPWFASRENEPGGHAIAWTNDISLPDSDREELLAWLAGDRAEGDPGDAPAPRTWPEEWVIGKPDAILGPPAAIPVNATGRMAYVHVMVPTDFGGDKWVRSLEVKPTAIAQVHHVLVFVVPPGTKPNGGADEFFAAYVPGSSALQYPDGYAKHLPAGSQLLFQLHYTPNGTAATDTPRLGLIFADGKPAHEVRVAAAKNTALNIPAGAADHEETGMLPVPFDARLLSFMPHMHVRGKAFRYELVLPDGGRRTLLDVPRYDFNWQFRYNAAEPVIAPKGSRIEAFARFDNSAGNPANPDPAKNVRWGDQTEDEMMIGYLEYIIEPSPIPLVGSQTPLALTAKALSALGKRLDADKDGRVSLEEAGATFTELHRRLDQDGDGFVTTAEAKKALQNRRH